jgi:hypothetical protein
MFLQYQCKQNIRVFNSDEQFISVNSENELHSLSEDSVDIIAATGVA